MEYPTELQEIAKELAHEKARHKCKVSCFCTWRCNYTEKEWAELQKIKDQYKFTGVSEMLNKIGD